MKYAEGNDKLGKGCFVVSRPVGDTCPPDCDYLNNGCYAEATENQYKNARVAGFANVITEKNKIRSMIIEAKRKNKSIRWQERGDWFLNGELDLEYVANVTWACESILADGDTLLLRRRLLRWHSGRRCAPNTISRWLRWVAPLR